MLFTQKQAMGRVSQIKFFEIIDCFQPFHMFAYVIVQLKFHASQ